MVSVPNNTVAFHAYLLGYHFQKLCTEYTFYMKNVNFGQQCTMFDLQAAVYVYIHQVLFSRKPTSNLAKGNVKMRLADSHFPTILS